jgi:photosystem II stability/assembly factor-like uncharacterized protein
MLAAAPVVMAQTVPPLTWELVGTEESVVYESRIDGLAFRKGAAPDGSLDTLYTPGRGGIFRFVPGAGDWERICAQARCSTFYIEATKEGYLLIGMEAGPSSDGLRSTDGGFTWEDDVIGVSVTELFQSTLPALSGAVYACNGAFCSRSFEGGAAGSWIEGDLMGGQPDALAEVAPSESFPEGRLLGGAWNGVALSDDGGQTWTPSTLWQFGRFVVRSLAFLPDSAHPYGGLAFAGVRDFDLGETAVYRSADGGQAWARVLAVEPGDYGVETPGWMAVAAVPRVSAAGLVFAGPEDIVAGSDPSLGPVLASADGGVTWAVVASEENGWGGFAVNVFEVARDGRLYAGTERGVWRTASPLPVDSEPQAVSIPKAELSVHPNPTTGRATVTLALPSAAEVRAAVYDVLGREVAVLHDGPLAAGSHRFAFDSDLPTGVYLVRATGYGLRAAQRVTVVR